MTCEHCLCAQREFNDVNAARESSSYLSHGPRKTTEILLDALRRQNLRDTSLLDIGGGIGAIAFELLQSGVRKATVVEASRASLEAAEALAERLAVADRFECHYGDFLDVYQGIEHADIVTLDRVVCCYPDGPGLIRQSAKHARRWYGLVAPRNTWYVRIGMWVINMVLRLRGSAFRTYLHEPRVIDRILQGEGFTLRTDETTTVWWLGLYGKGGFEEGAI